MSAPRWPLFALLAAFWWGIWGFLVKIAADAVTPEQLQVLFVAGMAPLTVVALWRGGFKLQRDRKGALLGVANGVLATVGMLAYYAAMSRGKASVVSPVTALFPLFTVAGAVLFLKERLNAVQMMGIAAALAAIVLFSL